jgi:hypothetical protein
MVVGSTLIGAVLSRLFVSGKLSRLSSENEELMRESGADKAKLTRITKEYNEYKAKATDDFAKNAAEINRLSKQNLNLSKQSKPVLTQAELDHKYLKWKKRAEDLSNELEYIKAKVESKPTKVSSEKQNKQIKDLQSQLSAADKKLREQELMIKEAQKANDSTATSSGTKKGSGKKKKKIKQLEAEILTLKKKLKKKKLKKS